MPNSYAKNAKLTCSQCKTKFDAKVWFIVDTTEHPDLHQELLEERLHKFPCPQCGHIITVGNAPLLVFQPDKTPPIFFSPIEGQTEQQNQRQSEELVQRLQLSLGHHWTNEWIAEGLPVFSRNVIASIMRGDGIARPSIPPTLQDIIQELQQPARDIHDMPRRIELCQQALKILPKSSNEQLWAVLQAELGSSLAETPLGSREQNIEEAIHAYQQALTVMTRDNMAIEWATTTMKFGIAYRNRIKGDKADNIEDAIHFLKQALTVRTQDKMPIEWATTTSNLGAAYSDRIKGDKADNIEKAIRAYQQALTIMKQSNMPIEWATTTSNLGNAYRNRIKGDKADNIEDAIHFLEQALTVMTQNNLQVEWASTTNNLGTAYSDRIKGDKADNIEDAIDFLKQALTVRTKDEMPIEWARTTSNLGAAYSDRIKGDKADNIEDAIDFLKQALTVRTKDEMPIEWARTTVNLGNAYKNRIKGDKADNIEQAIHAFQQALTVMTQDKMPIEWAKTMSNLGSAYADRIKGDKSDNIEDAIDFYQQALTVTTKDNMPIEWALTTNNLGNAYTNRIQGDKADNIEQANHFLEQSLTIRTQDKLPLDWAQTTMNLGIAYYSRIKGDKADNIEKAIHFLEQALTVYTREEMPLEWATTTNNLGAAYSDRIKGDKADNIEKAIRAYQQALTITTQDKLPSEWASTTMNIGNAYTNRIKGDKADNIEKAIHFLKQALTVRTQDNLPFEWATTTMNLGNAYKNRIKGDKADNIEKAIHFLKQALIVRTQDNLPFEWAQTTVNLGNAYKNRIKGDKADNIEQAIHAYQQALTVFTQDTMPIEWAQTMSNLGAAYSDGIKGDKIDNIEKAVRAYQQALTIRTQDTMPIENRDTLNNLGNLYFEQKNWEQCLRIYQDTIAVGKDIRAAAYSDAGRQSTITKTGHLYTRAAYSLIQLGRISEALQQLEGGKARLLAEAMSMQDSNLTRLDEPQRKKLQSLRDTIRGLEAEYRLPTDNPARRDERLISDDLRDTRAELRDYVDELRQQYPDFMPQDLAIDAMLSLIPENSALVAPLFTSHGSVILVVPHGTQSVTDGHMIRLDDFTTDDLYQLTTGTENNFGWLRYYVGYRFGQQSIRDFFNGIEVVTNKLWDAFIGKIHERLSELGVQQVLFMPQGKLSLLPVHVAWHEVAGKREYFMDHYQVSYILSMYALDAAQRRIVNQSGREAFVIGVSEYKSMNDLPNTKAEAEAIAQIFETQALIDAAATVDAIKTQSAGKNYLHLSCHGSFSWGGSMFNSALYLTDDEALTLSEIMSKLKLQTTRLVTLSACETGIVDFQNVPDEFIGLPAGFMQAGASAVVSSLWTVEDHSTALLMEKFYKNHIEANMSPAQALREAQFWLRDATVQEIGIYYQSYLLPRMSAEVAQDEFIKLLTRFKPADKPYEHPFYWAAFTYNGI